MSPEAQRIAIAEACGWKGPDHPDNLAGMDGWWSQQRGVWWMMPSGDRVMLSSVPDYLNDLNAIHEAEKTLDAEEYKEFARQLDAICACSDDEWLRGREWSATAAQRAEAFLIAKRRYQKWRQQ